MRPAVVHRLVDLNPEWLASGVGRSGMGVGFECLAHSNCRVRLWFLNCLDGEAPVTMGPGLVLYPREGTTFDTLEVRGHVQHGDVELHIHAGTVGVRE